MFSAVKDDKEIVCAIHDHDHVVGNALARAPKKGYSSSTCAARVGYPIPK